MNNKITKDIRVYKSRVFKESSYFYISFKDRLSKVVRVLLDPKQAFFGGRNAFPVLNSCRILRKHTGTDTDIDTSPFDKRKIDPNNNKKSILRLYPTRP
jgi:hypothetical protein